MARKGSEAAGTAAPVIALGQGIELRLVRATDLREQDLNAQVMQPAEFERLVENIGNRGALESLPYCAQPPGQDDIEIISGHHRVRAAVQAGVEPFWVMVDTSPLTRSQITAKQIAHNQLVGRSDERIIRQMLEHIENVDDLLETGLPQDFMPALPPDATAILTPHAEFDWRTVSLTFLPHQLDDFTALVATLDGTQDLVGVAPIETFEPFARALSRYQRIKKILSVGTALALLTRIALEEVKPSTGNDECDSPASSPARLRSA